MTLSKPDLRQLVDAIHELTTLGADELAAHTGNLNADAWATLQRLVTRAVERGIELQRAAILSSWEPPKREKP